MSSLYGNENPYSRMTLPDDAPYDSECKGCHCGFDRENLSRSGYCRSCITEQSIWYVCENCTRDWEEVGIAVACPNCWSPRISSDDRFIDDLIEEKIRYMDQAYHKRHFFASVLAVVSLLMLWSLTTFSQSKPDSTHAKTDTTVSRTWYLSFKQREAEVFRQWAEEQIKARQWTIDAIQRLKNDSVTVDKREVQ